QLVGAQVSATLQRGFFDHVHILLARRNPEQLIMRRRPLIRRNCQPFMVRIKHAAAFPNLDHGPNAPTYAGRRPKASRAVLGFIWFLVSYLLRLYVNVFIEPTVNPIKHFPAVTVAAKLLVPFWIPLTELFATPLMFLGAPLAYTIAFLTL